MNQTTFQGQSRPPLDGDVRHKMRIRLLGLNYHAFAGCVAVVLQKMGYEDVRLAGRINWRGNNQHGGYDIEASLPALLGKRRVIIQLKQFDEQFIYQRNVDELRGTCLRVGASEAVLVTTGQFAPSVRKYLARTAALPFAPSVAPVRLLDGDALVEQFVIHRVGVWEEAAASEEERPRQGLDSDFFNKMASHYRGNSRSDYPAENADSKTGTPFPPFVVTVQVQPVQSDLKSAAKCSHV